MIGEAAARVSESLRREHPEIPWGSVIAMRNVLVHHYFGIDVREIWNTIEKNLPDLERTIRRILGENPPEKSGEER